LAAHASKSPLAGIVIDGDLTRSIGAPVKRGDKLMTIAPAGQHRIVIQVSERDVAGIHPGQPASLALSALPWDDLPLRITRLVPVARAVDGDNVFEVEAELGSAAAGLRPGMSGIARIAARARAGDRRNRAPRARDAASALVGMGLLSRGTMLTERSLFKPGVAPGGEPELPGCASN
jgi:multidrug efflux pump subunit AcrA (membrane-fusion protein)